MRETKKIKQMKKIVLLKQSAFIFCVFFISGFLSGCVGMGSKFDCDVGSGGKCAPMHHINKMASRGAFNENSFVTKENAITRAESKVHKTSGYPLSSFEGAPIRSNESIQQIWIGPYEDTSGTYHEPSYIYTVVKKGQWIGDPAKVIQD